LTQKGFFDPTNAHNPRGAKKEAPRRMEGTTGKNQEKIRGSSIPGDLGEKGLPRKEQPKKVNPVFRISCWKKKAVTFDQRKKVAKGGENPMYPFGSRGTTGKGRFGREPGVDLLQ